MPQCVSEGMKKAIDEGKTKYTSNEGIVELRDEISKYLGTLGVHYKSNEICVTVGGSQGLFAVFMAIINEGDKVLIPDPAYPAYKAIVEMIGGEFVLQLQYLRDSLKMMMPR